MKAYNLGLPQVLFELYSIAIKIKWDQRYQSWVVHQLQYRLRKDMRTYSYHVPIFFFETRIMDTRTT